MSTRSCIAFYEGKTGKCEGVYCHSDGYPEGIGAMLYRVVQHYKDLTLLRNTLFDHPSGYSHLTSWRGDPDLLIGYELQETLWRVMPNEYYTWCDNLGVGVYYDGKRATPDATLLTPDDWDDVAYVYVIFPLTCKLRITSRYHTQTVIVDLAGDEPEWTTLMPES